MPIKRYSARPRNAPKYKKRRITRRKRMALPRRALVPMMAIKRKWWSFNWVPNSAATSNFWKSLDFTLANVPNFAELTALFDFYKMNAFKIELIPRYDSFAGNDNTDTTIPGVTNQAGTNAHVCYDTRTPATITGTYTSATLNTFLEQGRVKSFVGNRRIVIYYKPGVARTISGVNVFKGPTWLSTSNTAVNHVGPQVFLNDINFNGTFGNSYDIYVTAYIMLKGQK